MVGLLKGDHRRGWGGFWLRFCGGLRLGLRFRSRLLRWWVLAVVLWRFCGGFWLRFVPWDFFFFFFWWLGVKVVVGGGGCGCGRG